MSRSVAQTNADKEFDKKACQHVEKYSPRLCSFCIRDGEVYLVGEKQTVELVQESADLKLTVEELLVKMKALTHDDSSDTFVINKAFHGPDPFPLMDIKFKGPSWNYYSARTQLTKYFNFLGFGRAKDTKTYQDLTDEPEWFPDGLSWEIYKHASKSTLANMNLIFKSMFEYFNINIDTHHSEIIEESSSKTKRKKSTKKTTNKKAKTPEFLDDLEEEEEDDINHNNDHVEDRNPFYADSDTEEDTSLQEEMETELQKNDTVPEIDYVSRADDHDDFSEEDEVIINIKKREEQRKKNLQKNENRQSMLREINNL